MTRDSVARDVLTRSEAEARAARVSDVHYEIAIELEAGSTRYLGDVTISFRASGDGPLFVDFRGGTIEALTIDGEPVDHERSPYRIVLPGSALRERVSLRVRYENDFDTTGEGFHRFVDPEDGEEYVYTDFEPFKAHRLFPSFDQPDIKATYTVSVVAPAAWQVVSNGREVAAEPVEDGRVRHEFETTPRISTYLTALVCGPLHAIASEHAGIPMRLFCRRSLVRSLEPDAAELFTITAEGIDYFTELFGQPFPFSKYDQLFVPEYNAGAMENVGAVTYNEVFIFRDPPTELQRLERAEVVLHELCHAWFGDLATMRWWDDLWLNESFATYGAYLALAAGSRFEHGWKSFNAQIKRWAYRQDQLVTTHPIAADAPDTEVAFLNFDGITYGKGASVLKQLAATIGLDGFAEGMRLYFRRHAWGNATLRDFLAALEEGSGHALGEWARLWLETSSLDTLAVEWQADGDRVAKLTLVQTAPAEHPTLRPHAIELGLGREVDGTLEMEAIPVRVSGHRTDVPEAVGRPVPDLVFPNHGDHGYAKVALDPASVAYVRRSLERVADPLLRQLLWMSLWEMVRDRQLRSTEFLGIVREKVPLEPDLELLSSVLERAAVTLAAYIPESRQREEADRAFATAMGALDSGAAGDAAIDWLRAAITAARSAEAVARLLELADAPADAGRPTVDQEMRWSIAVKAVAHGLPGAEERVARELERDPSDRGQLAATTARAARPDPSAKAEAWERIHGEGYGSLYLTRAAMQGFFWVHQADIVEPYVPRFFDRVEGIFAERDQTFAREYMQALFPAYRADPAVLERAEALLATLDASASALVRSLRESIDDLTRSIAVRRYAES